MKQFVQGTSYADQFANTPPQPRLCDSVDSTLDSVRSLTPNLSPAVPVGNSCVHQQVVDCKDVTNQSKVGKVARGLKKPKKSAKTKLSSPLVPKEIVGSSQVSVIQPTPAYEYHTKPPLSYIALISMAILSTKNERMILGDIYDYMRLNWPFYNNDNRAWRNRLASIIKSVIKYSNLINTIVNYKITYYEM